MIKIVKMIIYEIWILYKRKVKDLMIYKKTLKTLVEILEIYIYIKGDLEHG